MVMTRAPLFVEKAHLFRDATLLVGYDTALRIGKLNTITTFLLYCNILC